MRVIILAIAAVVFQIANTPAMRAADLINDPDPPTIYLLQCKFSGETPAYDEMAKADLSVRSADEFHKVEIARELAAGLKARFASLEGVKEITVRFTSKLSEYDAQNGEYDFDISDGTYIPVSVFGRDLRTALINGTVAQGWKLPSKEAAEVLRKNGGDRFVKLALKLALQSSPPAVEGQPRVLNAKIESFDVFTQIGNAKLGHAVVE